jgi:preprotein translocase subunit SecG
MHVISNILVGLQILAGLVVIGLVLVQHGKGADMGASFGSGSSGSLFGAAGSANFLSRMTAVCATIFFLCTIGLAYMTNYRGASALPSDGSTVLDRPALVAPSPAASAASAAAASAPVPAGAAQIPGIAAPQEAPAASSSGASTAPAAAPEAAAPASGVLAIPTK